MPEPGVLGEQEIQMILRVLGVSLIGLTLAGCVNDSSLSGDVYSASEAKQVQNVTYGTVVNARPVPVSYTHLTLPTICSV